MSFNQYYQSELVALRELGVEFSERNPALAPFLSQQGRDPDVERLLEGFAFLTGRLRQKLDDELPELSHALLQLLWPNYLRPVPAFSMLAFEPLTQLGSRQTIAKGCEVEAKPLRDVSCQFKTCYDTDLYPLAIKAVNFSSGGEGGLLTVRLKLTNNSVLHDIGLKNLRLHCAGERPVAMGIYLTLLENIDSADIQLLDSEGETLNTTQLDRQHIQPGGLADNEGLMDYPLNTFMGYRYLQEYYCFPEKFLFVDVQGLGFINNPSEATRKARELVLRFHVNKAPSQPFRPSTDNLRLYCTPVVNLFSMDAMPLRVDDRQTDYKVLPGCSDPKYYGVFSINRIYGWQPGGQGQRDYHHFESFEHDGDNETTPYYSVRQRPGTNDNRIDTFISFGNRQSGQRSSGAETLSVELTCCNQELPRMLEVGDINRPAADTPDFARFSNITPVTATYPPPIGKDTLWRLVSNMSLNYLSMTDLKALRVVLETYDFPSAYDDKSARRTKRLLEGLQGIKHNRTDRLWQGLPVRGIHTELEMNPGNFLCEGDMYLFATVLNEFFALYSSINSFHELAVKSTEGAFYQWVPRMGMQPII